MPRRRFLPVSADKFSNMCFRCDSEIGAPLLETKIPNTLDAQGNRPTTALGRRAQGVLDDRYRRASGGTDPDAGALRADELHSLL